MSDSSQQISTPTEMGEPPPIPTPPEFSAIRWWPAWIGLAALYLLAALPLPLLQCLGGALGWTFGRLASSRRRIVRTNLQLCFPSWNEAEIVAATNAHFRALGTGVFEALEAWLASDEKLRPFIEIQGLENLDVAAAQGRGVLLLTGHFTTLEIGARGICLTGRKFHAMYRKIDNPLLDFWMRRWRAARSGLPALPKTDLRGLIRTLRDGRAIWYAPDQTLEAAGAIFVPFFGRPALTLTATARLAQMGRALVVPYFPVRRNGRYVVTILPALENFPSGDDHLDAKRINGLIEEAIRQCPEQYLWVHRKFKYQPPGAADVYA
jgi:KDO2-lipid IV(A) lauroyltransferase